MVDWALASALAAGDFPLWRLHLLNSLAKMAHYAAAFGRCRLDHFLLLGSARLNCGILHSFLTSQYLLFSPQRLRGFVLNSCVLQHTASYCWLRGFLPRSYWWLRGLLPRSYWRLRQTSARHW